MRSSCKGFHQSSSPLSVSDAASLPVIRKAGDEVKAQSWRRKMIHDSGPDQEAKARRQAQLEERHLEAYRNMRRLRDALYRRYAALLQDKVCSQRLALQQRHDTGGAKPESEKKKQKKLSFSKLQHNDSYLESLPKTSYYLNQLAQRGHLKTHQDVEDFHRRIEYNRHPSKLQRSLQDVREKMLDSRSAADLMAQQTTAESFNPLCSDGDRGCENHISHSRSSGASSSGEGSGDLIFGGSQKKDEIEQMFPKMKVPTFATLRPNFMRNFQSKMPDLIIPEIPKKSSKAETYLRRLKKMHDLCLANMDFARRLLDRETDSLCWQQERGIQDLVLPGIDSKQGKKSQTEQTGLSFQSDPPRSPQKLTSASRQRFETLVQDTAACCHKTPDPLSIEDVCQQKHVKIIGWGLNVWRNYTD